MENLNSPHISADNPVIKSFDGSVGDPLENKEKTIPGGNSIRSKINFRKLLVFLGIFLVIFGLLALILGLPLYSAYRDGRKAYASSLTIKDALKTQDIKKTTEAITATQIQIRKVKSDLNSISWAKNLPLFGAYISDSFHLVSAADHGLEAARILSSGIEPYADLLGLKGQGTFTGGTAEERITKMVETLDKVVPQIDSVASEMAKVRTEVDGIDPNRYPEELAGKKLRSRLVEFKDLVDLGDKALTEARPLVKQLPGLLGSQGEAKYMIIFQNDKELRPTGGFITAYAVFRVEKGKMHLEAADDIYKLDDTISYHVSPPDPISRYLNVAGWRIRDANFSPDFNASMRTLLDIYKNSSQKKTLTGVIAVDTQLLVKIMDVLGPINIYGTNFTTANNPACNCPMVVYELLQQAGQPRGYWVDNRKDMIGQLLQAIMQKALSSPKQVYGPLFQAVYEQAQEKHVLLYLVDPEAEKGIAGLGFGGEIKAYAGDYLHINDANLGGAKSNLFITQSVKENITTNDKGADVVLSIEYRYPHSADNCSLERKEGLCLAGIYRDYLRVYLPSGSIIKEALGFESKSSTFTDLGHTVVDGFFTVVPQGLAKIQIRYSVSGDFKKKGVYNLLIQKQPGTDANKYQLTVDGKPFNFNLQKDYELVAKL